MSGFALAGLVVGAASSLLLFMLLSQRLLLAERERRQERLAAALRPQVLAFLETGQGLPAARDRREEEALVEVLLSYSMLVRGASRRHVGDYMERTGLLARELAELASRRPWRRARAAYRLGDIASTSAVGPLIAALADDERAVRAAAARSLGRLGAAEAVEPLFATLVDRSVPAAIVRWALLRIGRPALPRIRRLLAAGEPEERAGAAQMLALLGDAGDETALLERLRDTAAAVREQAALALGRLGGEAGVEPLLGALEDRVPAVRAAAAVALGRLRDSRASGALVAHARTDVFEPARAAAHALGAVDRDCLLAEADRGGGLYLREAADVARLR